MLIFIGSKVFLADLIGVDKLPPVASLAVTLGILAGGVIVSLVKTKATAEAGQ